MKKTATRIYRYIRFRKGHGVHSPFAFGLINKVIEEKKPFYVFEEIEKGIVQQNKKKITYQKYGRLLFRLATFFRSQNILQIGFSDGVQALYLNAAAKKMIVIEGENSPGINLPWATKLPDIRKINLIQDTDTVALINELGTLDMLFLNVSYDVDLTKHLLNKYLPYVHSQSIFVIDGIHKKRMRKFWRDIKQRHDVSICMDLYSLGLVFFNRKLYKKNYKIFF